MKIKFIKTVKTPVDKAGKKGDQKDLADKSAQWLIEKGYAEAVAETQGPGKDK